MEEILYIVIAALLGVMVLTIGMIVLSVVLRKLNVNKKSNLKQIIFKETASQLTNNDHKVSKESLQTIRGAAATTSGLWYAASQFSKVHEIIAISRARMPLEIVRETNIAKQISRKIKSHRWQEKAFAIQYSYELGLSENLPRIKDLVNHKNKHVRREAQLAIVVFLGWKCLPFLTKITHPISLWQQIRIIEKLKMHHPSTSKARFDKVLGVESPDATELLMRLISVFKVEQHYSFISEHATDPDDRLSILATRLLEDLSPMVSEDISDRVNKTSNSNG